MLDPETYIPLTCYLENIKITDGTGKVVSTAILDWVLAVVGQKQ